MQSALIAVRHPCSVRSHKTGVAPLMQVIIVPLFRWGMPISSDDHSVVAPRRGQHLLVMVWSGTACWLITIVICQYNFYHVSPLLRTDSNVSTNTHTPMLAVSRVSGTQSVRYSRLHWVHGQESRLFFGPS